MLRKLADLLSSLRDRTQRITLRQKLEVRRLFRLARYQETTTNLLGPVIDIPDGPSIASSWEAIFRRNIYLFAADTSSPRILDCGANVGLACAYFKKIFPAARITAFEADPKIFAYLGNVLKKVGLTDIELIQKAVWSSDTTLHFLEEGSDSGRVELGSTAKSIAVNAVRSRKYLAEPIDLLKMDIEGAETEVLEDCAECLHYVRRIFVEYHSFSKSRQTLSRLFTTLDRAGFRVHVQPEITSAHPFVSIAEYHGMDLQLNIYAYRVPTAS